jgi:hypothetical protein
LQGIDAYAGHEYRKAIGLWSNIPASSPYYEKAQANIARARHVLETLEK